MLMLLKKRRLINELRRVADRNAREEEAAAAAVPRSKAFPRLLRRLGVDELTTLLEVVESRARNESSASAGRYCVPVRAADATEPFRLVARYFVLPDSDDREELRRLPMCRPAGDATCCNPYHWNRIGESRRPI